MNKLPNTKLLPVAKSSPANHSRATAHLLWQHLPRNPTAQDEYNARETCPVCKTRSSALGLRLSYRHKRLDQFPQSVRQKFDGHRTTLLSRDVPIFSTVVEEMRFC